VPLSLPVVLASGSPRRRELLSKVCPKFEVVVADVDESPIAGESPWELAERLAEKKARAVVELRPGALVIGGDTVVAYQEGDWQMLAKPIDEASACQMLRCLSGRSHKVITGFSLAWSHGTITQSDTSTVTFRDLTIDEIRAYVATGEPMDKAGSYAIQGGAAPFVVSVEGSISNIVGLPLEALTEALRAVTRSA